MENSECINTLQHSLMGMQEQIAALETKLKNNEKTNSNKDNNDNSNNNGTSNNNGNNNQKNNKRNKKNNNNNRGKCEKIEKNLQQLVKLEHRMIALVRATKRDVQNSHIAGHRAVMYVQQIKDCLYRLGRKATH
ncbi:probable serine/threonine-protein kinase DDB_G0291350 [Malaya genurostris]|uniref:probable serine/threonine-protein kinase DDB_G0291350 n=1 Tax=Malaya genurostris TaxID=325434 RepID=UPI0026F3F5BB|nr:probable serine/threonine-protein kinase DDB_G0291350 [Malaya genurostris]